MAESTTPPYLESPPLSVEQAANEGDVLAQQSLASADADIKAYLDDNPLPKTSPPISCSGGVAGVQSDNPPFECPIDPEQRVTDVSAITDELAVNTKRIRKLTKELKSITDCDAIKQKLKLTGDELKELLDDLKKEAKKLLDKYLPIVNFPLNPLKIIPWVKKLVLGSIMPQIEAYIKILKATLELIQATQEFIQAATEVIPKLEACAQCLINEQLDSAGLGQGGLGINVNIGAGGVGVSGPNGRNLIESLVDKTASEIADKIKKDVCSEGGGDIFAAIGAVKSAISLTKQVIGEAKQTIEEAKAGANSTLQDLGAAGETITRSTGIPFNVDTSSLDNFSTSINNGDYEVFKATATEILNTLPAHNVEVPTLSGVAVQGETLTVNVGTWEGTNVQYSYVWYRNNNAIFGANTNTYTCTVDDLGAIIVCEVDGDTEGGGEIINTAPSAVVTANNPVCTVNPVITAPSANVGDVITVSTGTWDGTPTLTYQWQRAAIGANIYGATANSYTISAEDPGSTITCVVTATSNGGTTSVRADPITASGSIGGGSAVLHVDTFTGNGSNTAFTLSLASNTTNSIVALNGSIQKPGTDYSVVSTALVFATAPYAADDITVHYLAV